MRIVIVDDVHGCIHALRAILKDTEAWSSDQVIVAGDLVLRFAAGMDCGSARLEPRSSTLRYLSSP